MVTSLLHYLNDLSFSYFEEVQADFHMFKKQRCFSLVSAKVVDFAEFTFQLRFLCLVCRSPQGQRLLEPHTGELWPSLLHFLSLAQLASWPAPILCSSLSLLLTGPSPPPPSLASGLVSLVSRLPPQPCLPSLLSLLLAPGMSASLNSSSLALALSSLLQASPSQEVRALVYRLVGHSASLPRAYLCPEFRMLALQCPLPPAQSGATLGAVRHCLALAWGHLMGERGPQKGEEEVERGVREQEHTLSLLLTSREALPEGEEGEELARLLGLGSQGEREEVLEYRLLQLRLLVTSCCSLECLLYWRQRGLQEGHGLGSQGRGEEELLWGALGELQASLEGIGVGGLTWQEEEEQLDSRDEEVGEAIGGECEEVVALRRHLGSAGLKDLGWVEATGQLWREARACSREVPGDLVPGILRGWLAVYRDQGGQGGQRGGEQKDGDRVVLEYGRRVGALQEEDIGALDSLASLGSAPGYDWTAATLLLLARGDAALTASLLASLPTSLPGPALWPRLSPATLAGISYCVSSLLPGELPALASALHLAHLPVAALLRPWLGQSFLRLLPLQQVADFFLSSLLLGPDYTVYYCLALLTHLQTSVLQEGSGLLLSRLLSRPVRGFNPGAHLALMDRLRDCHRGEILPYLSSLATHQA